MKWTIAALEGWIKVMQELETDTETVSQTHYAIFISVKTTFDGY